MMHLLFVVVIFRSNLPEEEHEAITAHLHNLFTCQLDDLPTEVLTDQFLTAGGFKGILPHKLTNYSKCLTEDWDWEAPDNAHLCKKFIREDKQCRYFNDHEEYSCYQRMHNTRNNRYNAENSKPHKRETYGNDSLDLLLHDHCINYIYDKTANCREDLTSICQQTDIRATKVIRFHMETAKHMLLKDPYIKVVLYVRDPRGIIESRVRNGKPENRSLALQNEASLLCEKMSDDLKVFNELSAISPESFMLVKYEDIVADYHSVLSRVYDFIGREVPSDVTEYFEEAMGGSKGEGNHMSTFRENSTATSTQWKRNLSRQEIHQINMRCEETLMNFDYHHHHRHTALGHMGPSWQD